MDKEASAPAYPKVTQMRLDLKPPEFKGTAASSPDHPTLHPPTPGPRVSPLRSRSPRTLSLSRREAAGSLKLGEVHQDKMAHTKGIEFMKN